MSIHASMLEALNRQLQREFASSYLYLSMSGWMASSDLPGAGRWLRMQSQEEALHAMKLYDFIESRDAATHLLEIPAPLAEWKSVLAVFEAALAHERRMTEHLNELVDLASSERDHASHNLLQWFIDEQIEEEATLATIVRRLRLVGADGSGLFILDTELGKRAAPTLTASPRKGGAADAGP